MQAFHVKSTRREQLIDITADVQRALDAEGGVEGLCHVLSGKTLSIREAASRLTLLGI